ncbi:glycine zipper domain-containing protein [Luteolibacter soli]|uniref:Glycine zipper domain-containing protein n=1 Tax=Luteolibacter soli TaxID=3135280 RepID=A0ABU9AZ88_9BACT
MNADQKLDKEKQEEDGLRADPEGKDFGTTFGAAHGAIAGGVIGSLVGPGGTVVGAMIGAGAGAAIGHVVGAGANNDESYWRKNLEHQPFYDRTYNYEDFATALRLGAEGWRASEGRSFEESEDHLRERWEQTRGISRLKWEQAKLAARAAWEQTGREQTSND